MFTVERDFKSLHPSMLYALEGKQIPSEDLYTLEGFPHDWDNLSACPYRKFFKDIMLTMINAKNEVKAFQSLNND
ncbi:MAG: hypothetical protein HUN04_00600 [Desulfobacter sp.]|nr:MAG: hypothetical protein HUN04_00600 [Desulfobacter sp.]